MENDPNKKDSKEKRIIKKTKRRNSKSSNNSQNSGLDRNNGSKSLKNKNLALGLNGTPLPKPDGSKQRNNYSATGLKLDDKNQLSVLISNKDASNDKAKMNLSIQENQNDVFEEVASASLKSPLTIDSKDESFRKPDTKRTLKRVCLI